MSAGVKKLRSPCLADMGFMLFGVEIHEYPQTPMLDGLDATRQIRQLPGCATIPILAMTANAFAENRNQCFEAGMDDFIVKPVMPEVLYETLLKWLDQHLR